MAKIVIVEDDQKLAEVVFKLLTREHHSVEIVGDGGEAEYRLLNYPYDLIILDWNLPHRSGPELCKLYRSNRGSSPVVMLTGKDLIHDKIAGFSSGVDDYLIKPFHPEELILRVTALLRRPPLILNDQFRLGDLLIDLQKRTVIRHDIEIYLQPRDFALREFLVKHADQAFGQEALLNRVWSSESESSVETVRTHIKNLRRKLCAENCDKYIKTVHKVGYKLAQRPEVV
jgi:two-component system, OmpR family, response regulator